jgi:hypothetical protein
MLQSAGYYTQGVQSGTVRPTNSIARSSLQVFLSSGLVPLRLGCPAINFGSDKCSVRADTPDGEALQAQREKSGGPSPHNHPIVLPSAVSAWPFRFISVDALEMQSHPKQHARSYEAQCSQTCLQQLRPSTCARHPLISMLLM